MSNTPPIAESFTCGRPGLKLFDRTYELGEEIPADVVAQLPRASALLSRRWIIPDPDTHGKTPAPTPQPTAMPAGTRREHLGR